jgi:phage shock protein A
MSDTTTTEGLRKEQELETLRAEAVRLREALEAAVNWDGEAGGQNPGRRTWGAVMRMAEKVLTSTPTTQKEVERLEDEQEELLAEVREAGRQAGIAEAENSERVRSMEKQLAECYRLTGADPDGNEDWRLAPHAVEEVRRLREKLDEAEHRVLMVEHLKDQLRSASVALENFWAAYESGV